MPELPDFWTCPPDEHEFDESNEFVFEPFVLVDQKHVWCSRCKTYITIPRESEKAHV